MTRSEIELIIRARNEAKAAFDSLNKQITGITGESTRASTGMESFGRQTQATGAAATATGVAVGLLADRALRGLSSGFWSSIDAANKLEAGLVGLSSVARAFDADANAAQEAAKRLASDGLMSVGEAATGLKNLLASGFSLDQAITLMERFKDSASFARQGSLEFGQAVVSATEGVKNGNSILVDNAGVTKNLGQILVEAGHSAQDLSKASSDASVRMALFNGIIKETAPQLGDTARFLDTAAGKQAQFNAEARIAREAFGEGFQPALAATLTTLTPLVRLIGQAAPVLAPLSLAIGSMVIPIVAVQAASALGITSLTGLATAFGLAGTAATTAAAEVAAASVVLYGANGRILTTADGLTAVSTTSRAAGSSLSAMAGRAGLVAAALYGIVQVGGFFEDWQDDIREAAGETVGFADSAKLAALQVGSLAVGPLPQLISSVRDLGDILPGVTAAMRGLGDLPEVKSPFEGLRVSMASADEAHGTLMQLSGASVNASQRLADLRGEIEKVAGAGGLGRLREALESGVYTTKELAEAYGISEAAVKLYADEVKASADAQERAQKAAQQAAEKWAREQEAATEKLIAQQERLRGSLASLGIVTREQVNGHLAELAEMERLAVAEGVPLERFLRAAYPLLADIATAARESGIEVAGLSEQLERASGAFDNSLGRLVRAFDPAVLGKPVQLMGQLETETYLANQALEAFGITSQTEHRRAADAAVTNYERIVRVYGERSPEAVQAHEAMVDAINEASGRVPTMWETEIFPSITRTVLQIRDQSIGAFGDMLTGMRGWKEGGIDILESFKFGAQRIFNDLLSSFVHSLLNGMLNAMRGRQGAFGQAFAGMFGGGGGGVAGLFGGGLSDPVTGAPMITQLGGPGGAATTAGAGWASVFGPAAAIGGGMALINAVRAGSKTGGALSGATTGAGIGTMILPGVGTAIGAGVGALGGFLAGAFGGGNDTRDQREAFAREQFGLQGTDQLWAMLRETLPQDQAEGLIGRALNQIGRSDTAANTQWMQDVVAALKEVEEAATAAAEKTNAISAATREYGLTWEDLDLPAQQARFTEMADKLLTDQKLLTSEGYRYDAVLKSQAGQYGELVAKSKSAGLAIPESVRPILEQLIEWGLLVDENGDKVKDLTGVIFEESRRQYDAAKATTEDIKQAHKDLTAAVEGEASAQTDVEKEYYRRRQEELEKFITEAQQAVRDQRLTIPVEFETPDGAPPPGYDPYINPQYQMPVEGGAAGGVMANRPGLVLFGEGGETEVGGPARFFKRIFEELGIGGAGMGQLGIGGAGMGQPVQFVINGRVLAEELWPYQIETGQKLGIIR